LFAIRKPFHYSEMRSASLGRNAKRIEANRKREFDLCRDSKRRDFGAAGACNPQRRSALCDCSHGCGDVPNFRQPRPPHSRFVP
jgi:hypothetical protein